jgi:hypothetical protein
MNSKWPRAPSVPMHVGLFNRPFMSLKVMSKSWEPCPFNKVSDISHSYTSNILRVKEQGTHIGVFECRQGFTLTHNVS